jgi:quinoprotein glucose dehydrogenase
MSRLVLAMLLMVAAAAAIPPADSPFVNAAQKRERSSAEEAAAAAILADKDLKVEVWAAEPLLANPVAFGFDEKGRCFVVETFRHTQGVPDTRGKPWLDDDLACRTVADRVAMYKKYKFGQYPENSERLKLVWDSDNNGNADKDSIFATGFNRYEDGLAAGVLARKGDVYFTCIPDLYLLRDTNGDNKADEKKSLATGFGVHVQFIGHDLHGLILGPDGKLYFSVGDRGFNLTTKEEKKLFNPDSGAVLRCDLDGSNLEVVHKGLRNPQELAFDDYGNLFTWDNNSDSGDRARWVYIVEGGDSGWRCGYQYGTGYHTPDVPQGNRGPWNTEKLWLPQWEGQAAYIVPALANFGNGPAGIVHYPGVGLNEKYKDHFFLTDFTGGPGGNSAIWTMSVKPKGASFAVSEPQKFIRQMLPTDCAFGPDGAFYWSDWTVGWEKPNKGRIFRVTDPKAMKNPSVAEAKKLIAEGMGKKSNEELAKLLGHPHQQVRQEAQYELASRATKAGEAKDSALSLLTKVAKSSSNTVARLHAVWALGMRRDDPTRSSLRETMLELLGDRDAEIRRTSADHLGDLVHRSTQLGAELQRNKLRDGLRRLMDSDPEPRVRAAAAVSYGKVGPAIGIVTPGSEINYFAPLFDLLKTNDDKDPYLRHAAVMGLVHATRNPLDLWHAWGLAKNKYDLPPVRMGVLLALRKLESEKVAEFLVDSEPRIVAEAARAVYDERTMTAFPALAKFAAATAQPDAVAYRALAANFWLGTPEAAARIARFAGRAGEPDHTRAFALKLLSDWGNPGRRDPVTGITMDLAKRDAKVAADALKAVGAGVFAGSDILRREATQTISKLGIKEFGPAMAALVRDAKQPVNLRVEALYAVEALKDASLKDLAALSLETNQPRLRAAGRAVRARLEPAVVLQELPALLKNGAVTLIEKQGAFAILASQRSSREADKLLDAWLDRALANDVPPELLLDVLDAAETRANSSRLRLYAPLKEKVEKYRTTHKARPDDQLASYRESLAGGDAEKGRHIVLNNSAVYCQRCHKLDGQGGEVGPVLNGIAADKEKDRRYLLESIVLPSAKIAKGFDNVILLLNDERTVSGIIKSEDKKEIKLVTAENKEMTVAVDDVASRRTGPSAMPADLHQKLSRRELRDVVEFLASLKEPLKK